MMIPGGIARLAECDSDQQTPQFVTVGQVELAAHLPRAEALEHALEHILLAGAAADLFVQVLASQVQQVAEIALPDQAGRHVAYGLVVRAEKRDELGHRTVRFHDAPV
jgi:hypothetical protein